MPKTNSTDEKDAAAGDDDDEAKARAEAHV
jgi:hypothetical protein